MTLGLERRTLDVNNGSGMWITSVTLVRELKALDAISSSGLSMTCATLGRELRALVAMNYSRCYELLKVVDDVNNSAS